MLYVELNDGRTENLMHISHIDEEVFKNLSLIVYYSAKGSLNGYREHFETEDEAQNRYEELQKDLLAN